MFPLCARSRGPCESDAVIFVLMVGARGRSTTRCELHKKVSLHSLARCIRRAQYMHDTVDLVVGYSTSRSAVVFLSEASLVVHTVHS